VVDEKDQKGCAIRNEWKEHYMTTALSAGEETAKETSFLPANPANNKKKTCSHRWDEYSSLASADPSVKPCYLHKPKDLSSLNPMVF